MPEQQKGPGGKKGRREGERAIPEEGGRPVTTGDMQEVGATTPEEVPERRRDVDGEAPVHQNPGDQNSG